MLDKLKAEFDGILELVSRAPAQLQEIALKTILEHWFTANALPALKGREQQQAAEDPADASRNSVVPGAVKPFLTANAVTTATLEKVFLPAGPGAQLVASDIPGSGKAAKLIHLSLLLCVKQALESGRFVCTLKELRELAVHYDCYDSTNFSKTLKANKGYYNPREKGADLELSGAGRKRAAEVIKTLASGD